MPQDIRAGSISVENVARVSTEHVERLARHKLMRGDVVFSRRGDVRRFAVVDSDEEGWLCGTGCLRLRVGGAPIAPGYLRWFLAHRSVGEWLERNAQGATMLNLNTKILGRLPLRLPPLPEQRRIAAILDKADAIRRKRREAAALTEELLRSAFLEMFGDPVTNPKGWPTASVSSICGKGQYGLAESATKDASGVRYVRITDIDEFGHLGRAEPAYVPLSVKGLDRCTLRPGDVLFARSGATAGKSYIHRNMAEPAVFAGYLIRFRPDPRVLLPEVLFGFTGTKAYWGQLRAGLRVVAQPNINATRLGALQLPLAPLDLQRKYVGVTEAVSETRSRLRKAADEADDLFHSLVQRAFRGDL